MPVEEIIRIRAALRAQGVFRARDLHTIGVTEAHVRRWTALGFLRRLGRGIYTAAEVEASPDRLIVAAAVRVSRGVICGPTAAYLHGLIAQAPGEVWLALPRKAWRPVVRDMPVKFVELPGAVHGVGVETRLIEGAAVPVYGAVDAAVQVVKWGDHEDSGLPISAIRAALEAGRSPAAIVEVARRYRVVRGVAAVLETVCRHPGRSRRA